MDKSLFLKQLRSRLSFLSEYDRETTVSYYNEIISDRMDNGMPEEEAVSGLGSIDEIVRSIKDENKKSTNKNEDKTANALTNLLMYALIAFLSFIIFAIVCTAIGTACSAIVSIVVGIMLAFKLGISVLLLSIGITLILTAFTLMSVPFVGYCKMGIKELSDNIR